MDGDIYRAYMQVDDPLDLPLGEIGQRDVISQQEAQPRVVVLEVHGLSHAFGELVYEAEDAVVGAGAGRIHEIALKVQAQVAPLVLHKRHRVLLSAGAAEHHCKGAVVSEELVVQHIQYFIAVYRNKAVPHARLMAQGAAPVY